MNIDFTAYPTTLRNDDSVLAQMPSSSSSLSSRSSFRSSRSSSRSSTPVFPRTPSVTGSDEYRLDSDGNPIKSLYGYEPSARRVAGRCLNRNMNLDSLEPKAFDQLPCELLVYPKKPNNNRKHYHFGIGVSLELLWQYCKARDLVPRHYHGNRLFNTTMVSAAERELDRLSGAKLHLCNIVNVEHDLVLSRYSNYTWFKEKLSDRDEQEVVDIIHRELRICEPPRWYHKLVESPSGDFF